MQTNRWLLAAALSLIGSLAIAAESQPMAGPANPQAPVAPAAYRSAFSDYRPAQLSDSPLQNWRAANDNVAGSEMGAMPGMDHGSMPMGASQPMPKGGQMQGMRHEPPPKNKEQPAESGQMGKMQMPSNSPSAGQASAPGNAAAMSEGQVVKIDKVNGKITIRHGPLRNLGMPGMTMVFRVQSPAMLGQVSAGDKIRFVAEKTEGALMVTTLETQH